MAIKVVNANTQMGASGPNHASGNVPDPGATPGTTKFLREDATFQPTGTVTSVAFTASSTPVLTTAVTGSPITTAGTINLDIELATQAAHTVMAGPTSGTAVPAFRTFASTELSDTANIAYDNVANVFTANQTVTDIILTAATTATTATAGAQTLPASPAAFLVLSINAVNYKLPLYNT